jgi:hypothetical protein
MSLMSIRAIDAPRFVTAGRIERLASPAPTGAVRPIVTAVPIDCHA